MDFSRRSVLACGAASFLAGPIAAAPALLQVPTVDGLALTVLIDSTTAVFSPAVDRPDFRYVPPPITRDYHKAFAGQWGYSLLAISNVGAARRTTLVDFGYTSDALLNNMALLGVAAESVEAMVLSHGHFDHFGGLDGLLSTGRLRRGTPLYVGGEEAFCARVRGTDPDGPAFGEIDRAALSAAGIRTIVSGDPSLIGGQGFTTGRIPLVSSERPRVPTGMLPGQGCERRLLDPSKQSANFLVDDAVHELGTAFDVAGRGLVVIGSCSHRGIINTVRRAQAVSGVAKIHAIVGGFHLVAPQTREQALETVALMRALDPDYIVPGHCSGETFVAAAQAAMPEKMIRSVVGGRYLFGTSAQYSP
ncbi:MBL fold metallo-hydrolase [Sphingomonas nostoxanthinifaciens]|uniref:MBL fold metallo-hydrolase n=1 Tax=Sphingomonas nostoxanthinifaciens TaxID=2872652 RepID=UPI001CC1E3D4|nr:MBL fold metallo-hydrolase [Sphingomonas nostoxanthinifaciens]UAK23485.1 MBL fold metallo-hydrolase [Sphingomonas nostoxanthinifaciens]